ncbi:MAG: recombination protein RecR [Clostridia bacterium]|nr:recombination protein RecR [Clostridia bacterium]MBR1704115.1 recombination protein RecR [Clostridia bacterium]
MSYEVAALSSLVEQFERIPGIGHKSAQRMAFYVLNMPEQDAQKFADSIVNARKKIHYCKKCCNLTEDELCGICANEARDQTVVCVVEDPRDVMAIERTHEFKGTYHVLHGAISPMSGIGPDQLTVKELLNRLDGVQEVIMATNPTVEGEATAMYLSRLLKPMGIRTTRLAYGVPVGADLEYADEVTLSRAMEGRRDI